jgi:DNA-binding Lrp family transcriptional regulator
MAIKLTAREKKILSAAQLNARASAQEIARLAATKIHSVHYVLNRSLERKIVKPFMVINPHKLGLTDYCVFFRTEGAARGAREEIVRICATEKIGYLAELGGKYQWSFSLFANSILPVERLLSKFSKALAGSAIVSSFAIRTEWSLFGKKTILGNVKDSQHIRRKLTAESVILDETDRQILSFLAVRPLESVLSLSKSIEISEGTARRRIEKLIKQQVILGFAYELDTSMLGFVPARALISCRYNDDKFYSKLFKFASNHPKIYEFVRCLGGWDYELNFEVETVDELGDFTQELYDTFGSRIHSVELVTKIKTHNLHRHEFLNSIG